MSQNNPTPILGVAFAEALTYAQHLHRNQVRKGTQIPYISHLLAVTSLVLEDGGNETEAIAALLHDAVEDQGGLDTLAQIRDRFGAEVAMIVEALSDATVTPKPPWRQRKEQAIQRLSLAPDSVLRVAIADRLHNARSQLRDYQQLGDSFWQRFNAPKADILWSLEHFIELCHQRQIQSVNLAALECTWHTLTQHSH